MYKLEIDLLGASALFGNCFVYCRFDFSVGGGIRRRMCLFWGGGGLSWEDFKTFCVGIMVIGWLSFGL